jgi:hypothetical protein
MPELYIYPDSTHNNYEIQAVNCQITEIKGIKAAIQTDLSCNSASCTAIVNNLCRGSPQINQIQL